jgi:uncharacterized delta-60 repeat protein
MFASLAHAGSGDLDPTFSGDGVVVTSTNLSIVGDALALQSSNIVVFSNLGNNWAVLRYTADGTLDTSFGTNGFTVSFLTGGQLDGVVLPDNRLVGVGVFVNNFTLQRWLANGAPDPSFGSSGTGVVRIDFSGPGGATGDLRGNVDLPQVALLQPDGKILVAGTTDLDLGRDFALARFLNNGTLDSGFGNNAGMATNHFGAPGQLHTLTDIGLQSDGKIIAIGQRDQDPCFIVRYLTNGLVDVSFGTNGSGSVAANIDLLALRVAIQSDDKIVIAGPSANRYGTRVGRLLPDGAIDADFGTSGLTIVDASPAGGLSMSAPTGLALQSDERIVVASAIAIDIGVTTMSAARLNTNGTMDVTFGPGGVSLVATNLSGGVTESDDVLLQSDGRIVMSGSRAFGTVKNVLARFVGGNSTDLFFNVNCSLTPATATNTVGTAHTVTATITTNAGPAAGASLSFSVISGPNLGQAGSVTTGVSGQGSFTYTGSGGAGTDTIQAIALVGSKSSTCTVAKVWVDGPALLPDLTVVFHATFGTCSNTATKSLCPIDATLTLLNNGNPYGEADFVLLNTCRSGAVPPRCKLKGALTITQFDLGSLPSHTLAFYLSADTMLDAGDARMKEFTLTKFATALAKGKPVKVRLKLPKGVDFTGQHILISVDNQNAVTESNDNNNTAASPSIPPLP